MQLHDSQQVTSQHIIYTAHLQSAAHLAACKESLQDIFADHCGSRTGLATDMESKEGGRCLSSMRSIHNGQAQLWCAICQVTVLGKVTEPAENGLQLSSSCSLVQEE